MLNIRVSDDLNLKKQRATHQLIRNMFFHRETWDDTHGIGS